MEPVHPIPHVHAFDISARGRIAAASGWHLAEKRVNTMALRSAPGDDAPPPQPAWPHLLQQLGATLSLSNRKAAELAPTLAAVNAVIDALNALPGDANYADLERAVGLRPPRESADLIGDAMGRVLRQLENRRAEAAHLGRR